MYVNIISFEPVHNHPSLAHELHSLVTLSPWVRPLWPQHSQGECSHAESAMTPPYPYHIARLAVGKFQGKDPILKGWVDLLYKVTPAQAIALDTGSLESETEGLDKCSNGSLRKCSNDSLRKCSNDSWGNAPTTVGGVLPWHSLVVASYPRPWCGNGEGQC